MNVDRQAYSVATFCSAFDMSRATFYRILASGEGPQTYHIGKRTMISAAAADEWRRRMEQTNAGLSNGKQSGPRIGMEKGPLTGLRAGLSR